MTGDEPRRVSETPKDNMTKAKKISSKSAPRSRPSFQIWGRWPQGTSAKEQALDATPSQRADLETSGTSVVDTVATDSKPGGTEDAAPATEPGNTDVDDLANLFSEEYAANEPLQRLARSLPEVPIQQLAKECGEMSLLLKRLRRQAQPNL